MKLLDVNLLLYAVNSDSPKHGAARGWIEDVFSGEERVALSWPVLLGFLRLTTSPRVLQRPLLVDDALAIIDGWLALPSALVLLPGQEHWHILRSLLAETGSGGNLTTDAHLAALAIEHGAELCSTDSDFARFPKLRWLNPLAPPG